MKTIASYRRMFATLLGLVMILISTFTIAQTKLQQAKDLKASFKYIEAIEMYKEAFANTPPGINEARDLAKCYMLINDSRAAEEWLAKVNSFKEVNNLDVLYYANALKANGKYKEAIVQYNNYAKMTPASKDKVAEWINLCNQSMEWMADSSYIGIKNEEAYNSENADFGLFPYPDGFIFTSDRKQAGKVYQQNELYGWTGNPYLKLYSISNRKMDKGSIKPINAMNNEFHNGPGFFDVNSKTYYFTRTKLVILKKPVNNDPTSWVDYFEGSDYTNRLEIFSSKYDNGVWKAPQPFKYNNPEVYSVGHPTLSPDGKTLYFVSDKEGGVGATDIYYCELLSDGSWGEPKNAGKSINSEAKELFPFIAKDGMLYFSSDGHPGMGGLDLFSAKGSKDSWSKPDNLKYPLNSPKDDFTIYFNADNKTGFFASNRDGGKGLDDIYSFAPSYPKVLILAINVKEKLDNNSLLPLKDVNLIIQNSNEKGEKNYLSDQNGKLYLRADCDAKYLITAQKDGYFTIVKNIKTVCKTKRDTVFVDIVLDKIVINKPIVLENIYYDFDKWDIRPDAAIELDKLVDILKNNPQINIELSSHTDSRGSFQYNDVLSSKRAKSAVDYIISKGISSKRITHKGYGERVLINKCADGVTCTEEEHQLNRRTEFKVTSIRK